MKRMAKIRLKLGKKYTAKSSTGGDFRTLPDHKQIVINIVDVRTSVYSGMSLVVTFNDDPTKVILPNYDATKGSFMWGTIEFHMTQVAKPKPAKIRTVLQVIQNCLEIHKNGFDFMLSKGGKNYIVNFTPTTT